MEPMLSVNQVARRLAVEPITIYRLLQSGQLTGYKVGRVWRVKWTAVEEYLNRNQIAMK